jgi:succinate-acetate transporter protein
MLIACIIALLFTHFIADFVFQSDEMATGKSKEIDTLFVHSGIYTLAMMVPIIFTTLSAPIMLSFLFTMLISHFIIDGITSRINSKLWARGERHSFFVGIGADQLLHQIVILLWIMTII